MYVKKLFPLLLSLLLLCGCADQAAAPPTLTPEPVPTQSAAPTPEPTLGPTLESTPMPSARQLSFSLGDSHYPADFAPGNTVSAVISAQTPKRLTAEEPFTQLYIRFSSPPGPWVLSCESFTLACGQNGYLHELVTLPVPCTSVTICTSSDFQEFTALGMAVFTAGLLPDWVQNWQPPCEKADILVLSTHNDDDILFFGGTEPTYAAERGYKLQVVYFTDQMSLHPRMNECMDALWYMGIRNYPVLGIFADYKDYSPVTYESSIPPEVGKAFLAENIRRFRPDVLITQDVKGEYGHPQHIYMLELFREVIEETNDPAKYPLSAAIYGTWDVPKTYIHLWGDPVEQTVMDWDVPLDAFDGLTGFEVAQNAYKIHDSQYSKGNHWVAELGSPYSSYHFGLYRSLVGPDIAKNDFFEHLPASASSNKP